MPDLALLGELVAVPAGTATIGLTPEQMRAGDAVPNIMPSAELFDDQGPARQEPVAAFRMMKGPVTNAAYAAMIEAGGYGDMKLFREAVAELGATAARTIRETFVDQSGAPGPSTWTGGAFADGTADHPVAGICFYEAAALARFYGARLPTEIEWEYVARFPDGRLLPTIDEPSGDGFANVRELGPRRTTPVGAYPATQSALGFVDLMGNVSEWTSSRYAAYPGGIERARLDPTRHDRVARGGNFGEPLVACMNTVRLPLNPRHRFDRLGARLVLEA